MLPAERAVASVAPRHTEDSTTLVYHFLASSDVEVTLCVFRFGHAPSYLENLCAATGDNYMHIRMARFPTGFYTLRLTAGSVVHSSHFFHFRDHVSQVRPDHKALDSSDSISTR